MRRFVRACFAWLCASGVLVSMASCGLEQPQLPDLETHKRRRSLRLYPRDHEIRLNHLQLKGTHNSYHIAWSRRTDISYTHLSLEQQLEYQGVRQVELDVFWSPSRKQFDVFHFPKDPLSNCPQLMTCLRLLRSWSEQNPQHIPLFILIEPKDPEFPEGALEEEILRVWPRQRILAPNDILKGHASLQEAIRKDGWPTLGESRGKAIFVMMTTAKFYYRYTNGWKHLNDRLLFVTGKPHEPYAIFAYYDHGWWQERQIFQAVQSGYMVRTRSDEPGVEARKVDYRRFQGALNSGAHLISTDYPGPVSGVNFLVEIPGGTIARCNPVTAPPTCSSRDLEQLD